MMRSSVRTARFSALLLGALFARQSTPAAPALPNLSGQWLLDKNASDDPSQKARDSGGEATSNPSGSPPPSSGSGGRHGGHGRHGSGPSEGGGETGSAWMEGRERLTIQHADPELRIQDGAGHDRVVYTDGRATEEERSHGGTTQIRAVWKDGHVEITSIPEHGPKIVETYAVAADGSQLSVTTAIEGRRTFSFRTVYEIAPPAPPAPPGAGSASPSGGDEP